MTPSAAQPFRNRENASGEQCLLFAPRTIKYKNKVTDTLCGMVITLFFSVCISVSAAARTVTVVHYSASVVSASPPVLSLTPGSASVIEPLSAVAVSFVFMVVSVT